MSDRRAHSDETTQGEEKRDRQMMELLNELRVAMPGVQILFGFLLTVPFAPASRRSTDFQRNLFFVTLLLVALLDRVPDRAVGGAPPAVPPGRAAVARSSTPTGC